jgi:hypothetical protein
MTIDDAWVILCRDPSGHVWWRPGAKGYTAELLHAGVYTQDEARKLVRREMDEAMPLRTAVDRGIRNNAQGTVLAMLGDPAARVAALEGQVATLVIERDAALALVGEMEAAVMRPPLDKVEHARWALAAHERGEYHGRAEWLDEYREIVTRHEAAAQPDASLLVKLRAALGGYRDDVDADSLLEEVSQVQRMAISGLFPEHPELDAWHANLRRLKTLEDVLGILKVAPTPEALVELVQRANDTTTRVEIQDDGRYAQVIHKGKVVAYIVPRLGRVELTTEKP